jgi:hypothetical protein
MWHYPMCRHYPMCCPVSYPDTVFTTPSDLQTPIFHSYEVRF